MVLEVKLDSTQVKQRLKVYFDTENTPSKNEYNVFDHKTDDKNERDFRIDFVTAPYASKGYRVDRIWRQDQIKFNKWSEKLDGIVRRLKPYSLFPREKDIVGECWEFKPNTNPMVGIAIEIENTLSKYFLGSLVAAAMAGRWGIVVVPRCNKAGKWVEVANRMVSKGYEGRSPIPSNVLVFDWQTLSEQITATRETNAIIAN
ncbi:MAG: hypothetical protein RLZZ206_1713 [Cyanobacteriota bacterium]|jgi:hypothetical protein